MIVNTRESPFDGGPDVVRGTTPKNENHPSDLAELGDGPIGSSASPRTKADARSESSSHTTPACRPGHICLRRVTGPGGRRLTRQRRAPAQSRDDQRIRTGAATCHARTDSRRSLNTRGWDSVPRSSFAIHSFGDLMAVWQSATNDETTRKRFYKLTDQAILDHPGDDDLVAVGIHLMAYTADPARSFSVAQVRRRPLCFLSPAHRQLRPLQRR